MRTPTFSVEVITLAVSNVERALRFYVDKGGFTLDVDYLPNDLFRVVQLTPPGLKLLYPDWLRTHRRACGFSS